MRFEMPPPGAQSTADGEAIRSAFAKRTVNRRRRAAFLPLLSNWSESRMRKLIAGALLAGLGIAAASLSSRAEAAVVVGVGVPVPGPRVVYPYPYYGVYYPWRGYVAPAVRFGVRPGFPYWRAGFGYYGYGVRGYGRFGWR
jgi:hypothetical protein